MYELRIIRVLEKLPVFSLADVSKIVGNRNYAKTLLPNLVKKKIVMKIMRDKYSFNDDPLIIAPFLHVPSFVSCASALSYYGLIDQIPNAVFLMTSKRPKVINYATKLVYHNTKHFFGYDYIELSGIKVPFAEPEKAFLDSIGIHPLNVIMPALDDLNYEKLLSYAKRMNEIKRIGYLLEKNGFSVNRFKVSNKYIFLDPLGPKKGARDKKWKLIVNC